MNNNDEAFKILVLVELMIIGFVLLSKIIIHFIKKHRTKKYKKGMFDNDRSRNNF